MTEDTSLSHAERVLAAIEAVLERRASTDQMNYSIEGLSLARTPITDLLTLRDRYKAEVTRQKQAAAFKEVPGRGRQVFTRFR